MKAVKYQTREQLERDMNYYENEIKRRDKLIFWRRVLRSNLNDPLMQCNRRYRKLTIERNERLYVQDATITAMYMIGCYKKDGVI